MNKNFNNVQENVNEAMDSRIVRMNEIKSIKLSSVSSKKRVAIKAAKTLIDYIMTNWDDMVSLAVPAIDPEIRETQPELLEIINSRREELDHKKYEELERKRKEEEAAAKAREEELKKLAQLSKKLKEEPKKEDKPQSQKKSSEPKKQEDNATTVGRGHKVERNIGDIHPNGKWVWVEYKPGKFDWRTIGSRAHQEAIKNGLKSSGVIPDKSSAVKTKEKKKKAAKSKKQEPKKQEVKRMTMEELNNAVKALSKNEMSDAQKNIVKYIKKGYRITADKNFMENADGDRKSIAWGAVEALMKRIKTTEENLPKGLFK